jgi:hypothetical protein
MSKSKSLKTPAYLTSLWSNLPATWRVEFGPVIDEAAVKATLAYGKKGGTGVALSFAAYARAKGYFTAENTAICSAAGFTGQHVNEIRNGLAAGRITMLAGTMTAHGRQYVGKAALPGGRKSLKLGHTVATVKLPAKAKATKATSKATGKRKASGKGTSKAKAKVTVTPPVTPPVTSEQAQAKLAKVTGQPVA